MCVELTSIVRCHGFHKHCLNTWLCPKRVFWFVRKLLVGYTHFIEIFRVLFVVFPFYFSVVWSVFSSCEIAVCGIYQDIDLYRFAKGFIDNVLRREYLFNIEIPIPSFLEARG